MPAGTLPSLSRFAAPALVALAALSGSLWALPFQLPLWRSIAILTAWAGSGMLAASLALMVREPHIAQWMGGLERMYRWHHRSGVLGYVLVLSHPIALAADGWNDSPQFAWQALAPWTQSWPVWLGWLALSGMMFGLATTFALHLPYRRWRGYHVTLGVAVVLGLVHAQAVLAKPAPALLVLMALAASAFGWRLLAGDRGLAASPYRVQRVEPRAAQMVELTLTPCATPLTVMPGQFVMVAFYDGSRYNGCGEFHPFTVSSIEGAGALRVTVKSLGACSQRIQDMEPDVIARVDGPFGTFLSETEGPQLWIAGGIGITPFIAALRANPRCEATTLIYVFRTDADAVFLEELHRLEAKDPMLEVVALAAGEKPPRCELLLDRVDNLAGREVQLCGPPAMVDAISRELLRRGVPSRSIHCERFDLR